MTNQLTVQNTLEESQKMNIDLLQNEDRAKGLSDSDRLIVNSASAYPLFMNIPKPKQEGALRTMLTLICIKINVKALISDEVINTILDHFRKYLRALTLEEVITAIELNLNGEFPQKDGDRINNYGYVDIDYLTRIINAYRLRKQAAFLKFNKLKADKSDPGLKNITDEESWYGLVQFFHEQGQLPSTWNWVKAFNHFYRLEIQGKSTEEKLKTKKQFCDWCEPVERAYLSEINSRISTATTQIERQKLTLEKSDDMVSLHLRKTYLQQYFNTPEKL